MSTEIVEGHDSRLYVIVGTPGHYHVCPVGDPVATYDRKFTARHDIRFGSVDTTTEDNR